MNRYKLWYATKFTLGVIAYIVTFLTTLSLCVGGFLGIVYLGHLYPIGVAIAAGVVIFGLVFIAGCKDYPGSKDYFKQLASKNKND